MVRVMLVAALFQIMGCTGHSVLASGRLSEAVELDDVELFYSKRPDFEFEEIAVMQIQGG